MTETSEQYNDYRREVLVERVELFSVLYGPVMPFKFFERPHGPAGRPAVLVKLTASDGTIGWGQSVPSPRWGGEPLESARQTLEHYLAPVVLGRNPFDIAEVHAAMDAELPDLAFTALAITKAGVDLALHDLMGKLAGVNVAALWGRTAEKPVEISWTVSAPDLEKVPDILEEGRRRGFSHFNIKVAPHLEMDVDLCRMVRDFAPEGFLWADANGGYDTATALAAAPRLAGAGAVVLEQPLRPHNITGYRHIRKDAPIPIVMDEGLVSPEQLAQYVALGCCDGAAMKPARCGGLLNAVRQIGLLRRHNLMFLGSGLTDPDIALAASLILYSAFGLAYPAALNGPQFLGGSLLKTPLECVNGRMTPPTGPGLGVEVDEAAVQEWCRRLV